MAIKVIAQRREVKLGKNPGKKVRDATYVTMTAALMPTERRERGCSQTASSLLFFPSVTIRAFF